MTSCTICKHPDRVEIEQLIIDGTSFQKIGDKYGLSKVTVWRHKTRCMAIAIINCLDKERLQVYSDTEKIQYRSLFDEFYDLKTKTEKIYDETDIPQIKLIALKELRGILVDMARLSIWVHKEEKKDQVELSPEVKKMIQDIVKDELQGD